MAKETRENNLSPEERLRCESAERLSALMARSMRLLDDCAMLAATGKTDAVGAVMAAAHLLKSNAVVAGALLRVVQGETRHRSIVERINGGSPGLNPNFSRYPGGDNRTGSALDELKRRIERLSAARKAEEKGVPYMPSDSEDDDGDHDDDT